MVQGIVNYGDGGGYGCLGYGRMVLQEMMGG